jgi:hypothetical protein
MEDTTLRTSMRREPRKKAELGTPGRLLSDLIDERGIEPTAFARALGGKDYQFIYRWMHNRGFNEENQRRAAVKLGLPEGHFSNPDMTAKREQYRRMVFNEFCASELVARLKPDAETLDLLERIPFLGTKLPSVPTYAALLLALGHWVTIDEAMAALEAHEKRAASLKLAKGRKAFEE